jgi:outer membrane receptor protein involved in Fe transport
VSGDKSGSKPPVSLPTAKVDAPGSDTVIELSPFVVSSDQNLGYSATTTLAGTRIRTELKDVGASISVVTEQFLRDTGATDSKRLLTYTTGTEVVGPGGNFSGASFNSGGFGAGSPTENLSGTLAQTRLRGLAAASEARNFFGTSLPFDSYNIERVEINRGANSILFGTGSPAGIINTSTRKAEMNDKFEIEGRYGSYGSSRLSFDLNQQLLRGELAVRLAAVDKRENSQQDYAFEDDRRIYGALTYSPRWALTANRALSGTVLRANYENADLDSRRPRTLPPQNQLTGYFKPYFPGVYPAKFPVFDSANFRTNTVLPGGVYGVNPAFMVLAQRGTGRSPTVWFSDPASGTPGIGVSANGVPLVGAQTVISNMTNPAGTGVMVMPTSIPQAAIFANVKDNTFYRQDTLNDTSIFDYRNQLLEGPNGGEYANFNAYNASLEQRFFADRLGFELGLDKQKSVNGDSRLSPAVVGMDLNTSLISGEINPNYGRPFFLGNWTSNRSSVDRETQRVTGYYRLDSRDLVNPNLAKWLGVLNLTGLGETGKFRQTSLSGPRFYAPGWTFGNSNQVTDQHGIPVFQISYLGPSLANASTASGANLKGLKAQQIPTAASGGSFRARGQTSTSQFVVAPVNIVDSGLVPEGSATGASDRGSETKVSAFVAQYKFLQDTLVGTYGWRRDKIDSFDAGTPSRRGPINNLLVDPVNWPYPAAPTSSVSAVTHTKSLVAHMPSSWVQRIPFVSQISARYNTSENFSPSGARFDTYLSPLASPAGKSKDYGFILGLAGDRITLGATWYETSQIGAAANSISGLAVNMMNLWGAINTQRAQGINPDISRVLPPPDYLLNAYSYRFVNGAASFVNRSDVLLTQDYVSKGVEFEAQVNLTKQWRLLFNAARQEAVTSNTGAAFRKLFFEDKFNGQTYFENWTGAAGQAAFTDQGGFTLARQTFNTIVNPFYTQALQDGGAVQEMRKWRSNVVTSYDFSNQSALKGFGVGAGARWQDKVAIGFPVIDGPGGLRVSDVQRPFYGPTELNLDGWVSYRRQIFKRKIGLTLQLNVYNALDDDKLIPVATQPDGSIAAYRFPSARRFELTTRFSY